MALASPTGASYPSVGNIIETELAQQVENVVGFFDRNSTQVNHNDGQVCCCEEEKLVEPIPSCYPSFKWK